MLDDPPSFASLGKSLLGRLSKLNIKTWHDLLLHLPLRYLDESRITAIRDLRVGETAQVQGKITLVEVVRSRRPSLMVRILDESGELFLRFLHFYPRQLALFQEGMLLRVLGEARLGARGLEMVHPTSYKDASLKPELASALTAIYPTVAGLSQAELRRLLRLAFRHAQLTEILPPSTYTFGNIRLPSLVTSLRELHYPSPELSLEKLADRTMPSWQRLAFDELLAQQLLLRTHYAQRKREVATAFAHSQTLVPTLLRGLPFTLTRAQQKVVQEIANDLQCPHPMHRLLQGDVGSGKTIVACIAALQVIECRQQVALLAPTEILAEQHYQKMQTWLAPLAVKVVWLTSGQNKRQRNQALLSIADGTAQLVIGTHAIFQKAVHFQALGLSIVDEQHRFGVAQRLALQQKGESRPHQLMMSATPIPRTLAMSYYADLEVSIIDELPRGRSPVITKLVTESRREEVLQRVYAACLQGQQVYWVCPLIEESEALQLQTANDTYALLQKTFAELSVGLVHGKMKALDKQAVMTAFCNGSIQILVATTVVEVGVDVANASLMVIEHAERMGLSQLHQLRGRVGRGHHKSTCILLYQSDLSDNARKRLKIIYENNDGFVIAQADLKLRGPGEVLGVRQSGVPILKIAELERDAELLRIAREKADELLRDHPVETSKHLERWMPVALELVKV